MSTKQNVFLKRSVIMMLEDEQKKYEAKMRPSKENYQIRIDKSEMIFETLVCWKIIEANFLFSRWYSFHKDFKESFYRYRSILFFDPSPRSSDVIFQFCLATHEPAQSYLSAISPLLLSALSYPSRRLFFQIVRLTIRD